MDRKNTYLANICCMILVCITGCTTSSDSKGVDLSNVSFTNKKVLKDTLSSIKKKKVTEDSSKDRTLSDERILKDISELDSDEFKYFLETDFYQDILKGIFTSDYPFTKFFNENQCFVHVDFYESNYVLPLESCNYSSILLFYYQNKEDTNSWVLDTVVTTFSEFDRIRKGANYYKAGQSRCNLGYCQWYYTILQIEGAQITEIYDYYSQIYSLRLEHYLSSGNSSGAFEEINDTVDYTKRIEEFNWEGDRLKSIMMKNEIGILKDVVGDSLVLQTKTFDKLVKFY